MIKNKTIRKPNLGKTFLKFLSVMTLIAVIISVLLTSVLNSILKNTIALEEIKLFDDVNTAFNSSKHLNLCDAMDLTFAVNNAPKTIGRDVAVYLDGELIAYTNGYMCLPSEKIAVTVTEEDSELAEYRTLKLHTEIPSYTINDYSDIGVLLGAFPFLSPVFDEEEEVTTIGFVQLQGEEENINVVYIADDETNISEISDGDTVSTVATVSAAVPESFSELKSFDESEFTETLGITNVLYDTNGNLHSFCIKATPNKYITSIFSNTKGALFIIYGIILAGCLIIGAIISIVSYYKNKSIYETFSYRTSLTNALAHDLKTPLMAISSYAENYEASSDSSKKDYYVGKISENATYMGSLIANALTLSKAENSEIISKEEFMVKDVVNDVLEQLSESISNKNLKVTTKDLGNKKITSDKTIFKAAVVALLENSVKFAKSGSEILVSSNSEILKIENTFEGKIENIDTLKEAFVRGNKARGENDGSGLGLAIADKKLENLGMSLDVIVDGNKFTSVIK